MTEDPTTIHVDEFLAHPPAKVWRALTEPELLARWFMPSDFQLEVGHRYTIDAKAVPATGFSGAIAAEVLAFESERMLRVGWRDADPNAEHGADWTITWTLEPEGKGTRLFLEHAGFDPDHPLQQKARTIMDAGWRSHVMRRIDEVLRGLESSPNLRR
ncbi:SRPBCC domain-containing protein [Nocardia sp. NPDC049526]|uniref:SRPBCC domain-containing protein n=1 Tax=Nocardia sp. NPDC049526 TaxID=3364316 RepID=UPI0037B1FC75